MTSKRAEVRFEIPPHTDAKSCLSCGSRIFWIETPRGKRMCVNPDGVSHFATCSAAEKWRGTTRAKLREQDELFGKDGGNRR